MSDPKISFAETFICSAFAACFAEFFTTPLDVAKVRLQLQRKAVGDSVPKYRGLLGTLATISREEDTEPAKASRRQLKDAIQSVLFDMNVPAVCAINQATLALYAARQTSGIVVNIGFQVTSVVPILHGKVMRKVGVEVMGMGAMKLTGFLKELMQQTNIRFESLYTASTLKENLCYVASDYNEELSKDTQASFQIPAEGWFTLSKERFQTREILFQPLMAGLLAMGLHNAVSLCIEHCQAAELTSDNTWFKTVVLSGGTACLPGLSERLEKELREILSPSLASGIRVIPPPFGRDTAWFGAKYISNAVKALLLDCCEGSALQGSGGLEDDGSENGEDGVGGNGA